MEQFSTTGRGLGKKINRLLRSRISQRLEDKIIKNFWDMKKFGGPVGNEASTDKKIAYFKKHIKVYDKHRCAAAAQSDTISIKRELSTNDIPMELKLLRKSLGIVVHDCPSNRCPPPIESFSDPKLTDHFKAYFLAGRNIKRFKNPSAIQKQVWPAALSGHDVLGISPTGSGKTLVS